MWKPTYRLYDIAHGHNKLYLGLSAAISSVLTNVFMTPLDTIRARYQLSTKKLSVKDVIKELWSNEGYKGFYKGLINIFLMHAGLHSWPEKCSIMSWKYLGKNMLGSHSRFFPCGETVGNVYVDLWCTTGAERPFGEVSGQRSF